MIKNYKASEKYTEMIEKVEEHTMRRFILLLLTLLLGFTACAQTDDSFWDNMRKVTENMNRDYNKPDFVLGDYVFKHKFGDMYICTLPGINYEEAIELEDLIYKEREKILEKYGVDMWVLRSGYNHDTSKHEIEVVLTSKEEKEARERECQQEKESGYKRLTSLRNYLEQ